MQRHIAQLLTTSSKRQYDCSNQFKLMKTSTPTYTFFNMCGNTEHFFKNNY